MARSMADRLVYWISGEFVLENRFNGGTVVFLRACIVTAILVIVVLPAKSYLSKDSALVFSVNQLKIELGELIPWAGAIFAAAYAALYARFAAQWNYLASLYNQIVATSLTLELQESKSDPRMHGWRAAFVEDAIDLHLAGKSMFRDAIVHYLSVDQGVLNAFVNHTSGAAAKIDELERRLGFHALPPSAPASPVP